MKKNIFIALITLAVLLSQVPFAGTANAAYQYRFDDVHGLSGVRGQWVVAVGTRSDDTYAYNTRGSQITTDAIQTEANFVNSRDHVYSLNGNATGIPSPTPKEAIHHIFMVIPENKASMLVDFTISPNPDSSTGDVSVGDDYYSVVKDNPLTNRFRFDLTKTSGAAEYGTVRTYMTFHQDPALTPSQTLNVPLIISNVANGGAETEPLEFRSAMREATSGDVAAAGSGDIVAYDHFKWNVLEHATFGGGANDWIFVPVKNAGDLVAGAKYEYGLTTHIRNYCGLRYALQRYDGETLVGGTPRDDPWPALGWRMDLPEEMDDIDPELELDELSHIAPGLITTYYQPYNVITAAKKIFTLYPVDPTVDHSAPRELDLRHSMIYGVDLGLASDVSRDVSTDFAADGKTYSVRAFRYIPGLGTDKFLADAAVALADPKSNIPIAAKMPNTDDETRNFLAIPASVSRPGDNVTADAVSAMTIDVKIPEDIRYVSSDRPASIGLLPLHLTFNLPRGNRYVAPKWDQLMNEWRKSGDIMDSFFQSFRLRMHPNNSTNDPDLSQELKDRGLYDSNVKVFMDEEMQCITVSVIVMLVNSTEWAPPYTVISDVLDGGTTNRKYLTIWDNNPNTPDDPRWDMTFYVSYLGPQPPGPTPGPGGGGGGCSVAGFAPVLFAIAVLAVARRRKS